MDEKQKAVRSATLLLLKQSDSSLVKSALSDQEGHFQFNDLNAGKYFLQIAVVSHQRLQMKTEIMDTGGNEESAAYIQV